MNPDLCNNTKKIPYITREELYRIIAILESGTLLAALRDMSTLYDTLYKETARADKAEELVVELENRIDELTTKVDELESANLDLEDELDLAHGLKQALKDILHIAERALD